VDLAAELGALARALSARGVEHAFCGAVALAVHGVPRATRDLDVVVPPAQLDLARAAAADVGFTIEALPITFASTGVEVRRFTKLVGTEHLTLDVLVASGPLEGVLRDAETWTWAEGPLRVVSRATLSAMKSLAGRPQDLADLARLREVEGDGP
jgi:hypothetical protein